MLGGKMWYLMGDVFCAWQHFIGYSNGQRVWEHSAFDGKLIQSIFYLAKANGQSGVRG
jgi:hypothetical protein